MLNEVLYGSNYPITNYEKIENKIILHVKSTTKQCKCPECHQESNDYHATYTRKIQDTPLQNTETWVHVTAYEFKCNNPECKVKTFTEELPFVRKNKVMTNALIQFILAISIFLSSSATSLIRS